MPTAPIRFKVKLRYKNKDFVTVPLELSVAEGGSLDNIEAQPPSLDISRVQLQGPDSIPLLPLRYQIAQKLHACTEDLGPEQSNQRARDLHGLLLIEELGLDKKDLPAVREACVEIFSGRGKHSWPPTVIAWGDWPDIWDRLADDEHLDYSLDEAVERVRQLVARIENSPRPAGNQRGAEMSSDQLPEPGFEKVFRLPEGFRPTHDSRFPAVGGHGNSTTVIVQADGWVWADPKDSPISLDSITFTVD